MKKWTLGAMSPLLFIAFLTLMACGDKKSVETKGGGECSGDTMWFDEREDETVGMPAPKKMDEVFSDFLFFFAERPNLQRERIVFPLPVRRGNQTTYIERSQWKAERFFFQQGYSTMLVDCMQQLELSQDTSLNLVMLEKIFLDKKVIQQFVFSKNEGKWMLEGIENEPFNTCKNSSFLSFYRQFAADSLFRMQHIKEPLEYRGPDPEDESRSLKGVMTLEEWEELALPIPSGVIYNADYGQKYTHAKEKILVVSGISNSEQIALKFRKEKTWHLVYVEY